MSTSQAKCPKWAKKTPSVFFADGVNKRRKFALREAPLAQCEQIRHKQMLPEDY